MSADTWYPAAAPEKNVWGRFEWFEQLDVKASQDADEEKFKKIITIRIKAANSDGDSVLPVRPFNQSSLVARFPDAWRAFNGEQIDPGGTSLDEMHLDDQQVLQLKMYGIHNVDMLAALSDQGCGALGFGWRKVRDEAKGLIEAKKNAYTAALLAKVDTLTKTPEPPAETVKRGPGRPRKAA